MRDVLRVKFELGLFDRLPVPDPKASDAVVGSAAHREVALQASRESLVLLKNENQTLPLSKSLKKVLICGPGAKEKVSSLSRYGSFGGEVISVEEGMRKALPGAEILYAKGCEYADSRWPLSEILPEPPNDKEKAQIDEAVKLASQAEAVVVVLGESDAMVGESKSRTSLDLPGFQNDLV
ncbi:MAG: beta-glucosidase, partial [Verrucomicrobia bacterium]|nr:beta-glucosidase [Verrucomicrobiota bacterium]